MSWIAPAAERVEEPTAYDERSMLELMLEWQRSTLLRKCAGLDAAQLAQRSVPPSTLSLLGLVRHLTDAERHWFRRCFAGDDLPEVHARDDDPDAAFTGAGPDSAEADYQRLLTERDLCRDAARGRQLDEPCAEPGHARWTLRWVYTHMIEEYARHNGHADLLREAVDGATGE